MVYNELLGKQVKAVAISMGGGQQRYPVEGKFFIEDNTCMVETSDQRHHAVVENTIQAIHPQEGDDPVFLTTGEFEAIKALVSAVPMWERGNFLNMVAVMTGADPSVFLDKLGFEHSPYGTETASRDTETGETDGRVSLAPLATSTASQERLLNAAKADELTAELNYDGPCPGTVFTGNESSIRRCSLPIYHDGDCQ